MPAVSQLISAVRDLMPAVRDLMPVVSSINLSGQGFIASGQLPTYRGRAAAPP